MQVCAWEGYTVCTLLKLNIGQSSIFSILCRSNPASRHHNNTACKCMHGKAIHCAPDCNPPGPWTRHSPGWELCCACCWQLCSTSTRSHVGTQRHAVRSHSTCFPAASRSNYLQGSRSCPLSRKNHSLIIFSFRFSSFCHFSFSFHLSPVFCQGWSPAWLAGFVYQCILSKSSGPNKTGSDSGETHITGQIPSW